jgi:hypothetical protein
LLLLEALPREQASAFALPGCHTIEAPPRLAAQAEKRDALNLCEGLIDNHCDTFGIPDTLATLIMRRTRWVLWSGLLLFAMSAGLQADSPSAAPPDTLGTRLAESMAPTETGRPRSESAWDMFRLAPPPRSPGIALGQDWGLRPGATAGIAYDDNLVQRKNAVGDGYGFLMPELSLGWEPVNLPEGNALELGYAPRRYQYFRKTQYDRWDHAADGSLTLVRGRSRLDMSHRYLDTADPSISQSGRPERRQHLSQVKVARELGEKTRLSVDGRRDDMKVTSYATLEYAGGLLAEILPRPTLAAGLGYHYRDVETARSSGSQADSHIHEPTANLRWRPSEKWLFTLRAGAQFTSVKSSGGDRDQVSPLGAVAVNYTPSDKTRLLAEFSSDKRLSYWTVGQFDQTTQLRVAGEHHLSSRFTLTGSGWVGGNRQTAVRSGASSGGTYHFWEVATGIGYQVSPRSQARLQYRHRDRSSSAITEAITRNVVELSFAYRF